MEASIPAENIDTPNIIKKVIKKVKKRKQTQSDSNINFSKPESKNNLRKSNEAKFEYTRIKTVRK